MTTHIIVLSTDLEIVSAPMIEVAKISIKKIWIFTSILLLVLVDQGTKEIARSALKNLRTYRFFDNVFTIQLAENPGAFLSLGATFSETTRFWIFVLAVGAFLSITLYFLFRKNNMDLTTTAALTLLTGGGIGNLIDRIVRGRVTDFLHLGYHELQTGVFNIADMAIVAGVGIFLVTSLIPQHHQQVSK
jgi:signal peptidase II